MDLSSATEGVALASNTDVARFTVNNSTDTASAFTATIDWGDGTTTTGATIVGSNGSFTVDGGHTYADEGSPQATVTITRTADNTQIAPTGTVSVADTDNLTGHGLTFSFVPNTPLTNVTVATFTDSNTVNGAGDFTANIDWGDGTVTAGTVSGSNGSFSILGSHTYTASGDNTITVFMNDDFPDAAFAFATSTAVSGFAGQINLTTATEGTALINATVASFADTTANLPASDYTASIDWGDGTTTPGTVAGSNGSFSVQGTHNYADEGNDLMAVTITRTTDTTVVTPTGSVAVLEGDLLTPTAKTIGGQPGVLLNDVDVASFADINNNNHPADFTATIDWGDGTISAGNIFGVGGGYTVSGSHTYLTAGQDTISVTLTDNDPGTASATANSTAFIGFAAGDVVLTDATEGVALPNNTPVATFTDGTLTDTAGSFTATINWGDGATSAGTIVGSNGSFTVEGGHAYADEGNFSPIVTITRTADSAFVVDNNGSVDVAENDVLTPHGTTISGSPGQVLSNVVVATFSDTDTTNVAGDFTATIDWGDGTTTPGTVSGSGATFSVAGTHTYAANGHDTINVTLTDDAPGTATASANSTANIGLAGQVVLTSATEHVALASNTAVATFVDPNGADTAGSFTSTINWGDGTTSAGTVSGSAGSFTVSGGHTYGDEGNFSAIATLTRTSDNQTGTGSGSVAVAEHDALSAQGTTLTGTSGQALSNVIVATFTDTDTAAPASDFVATIDWGDGTTSAGTIAGSNGAFSVSGTHTYATGGNDTVTVTVADDAPGTATASTTTAAAITGSTWHAIATGNFNAPAPFVGSGFANDIVFQRTDGTPQIWAINGTSVTSEVVLPAPPSSWHVITTADFGNGQSDVLWQNTNGQPAIWIMNGTTFVSQPTLPTPPSSWHVITTGNFGNGQTDILWQNDNGTPAIWLMNGTTLVGQATLPTPPSSWHIIATGNFGNGQADILWQNTNGQPAIWMMNGTTFVSQPTLPTPPSSWHVITTGDFAGNGMSDILWQNDNGTPAIWMMNGTSIVADVALPDPGASWKVITTGDFNKDGKADILFQNSDGTPMIWEMNGTSIISQFTLPNPNTSGGHAQTDASAGSGTHLSMPDTVNGDMHLSAPDTVNGNAALGPPTTSNGAGGTIARAGGPAWGALGGMSPASPLWQDPMPGSAGIGVASQSPLLGGTTVANAAHLPLGNG
jgi:hypothetical protein